MNSNIENLTNTFLSNFELVFDLDWDYTRHCLITPDSFQCESSFINNEADDESNNWKNRKTLLDSYRELVKAMMKAGLHHRKF